MHGKYSTSFAKFLTWGKFVEHPVCEEEETVWLHVEALMVVAPTGGVGRLGPYTSLTVAGWWLSLIAAAMAKAVAAQLGRGGRTIGRGSSGGQ